MLWSRLSTTQRCSGETAFTEGLHHLAKKGQHSLSFSVLQQEDLKELVRCSAGGSLTKISPVNINISIRGMGITGQGADLLHASEWAGIS